MDFEPGFGFGFGGVNFLHLLFVGFAILLWLVLLAALALLVRFLLIGTKAARVYLRLNDHRPHAPTSTPSGGHAPAPAAGHASPSAHASAEPAAGPAPASAQAPSAAVPGATPADPGRPTPSTPDPTLQMPVPHDAPTVPLQSGAVPLEPGTSTPKRTPRTPPKKSDE